MKLSIVTTLYQSAPHIEEFHQRTSKVVGEITDDYEIIFVNDGSPDNSLEVAIPLHEKDSKVKIVDLSRNFGHHKAMMTGLAHASGEYIFLIDSDLEEEPELLSRVWENLYLKSHDVVYGVQDRRKGNWFERISGNWFYRFFRLLTGIDLADSLVTARLMTRRYVDALLLHDEREVFLAGLWHIPGFDQRPITIKKHNSSETSYTLRHKLSVFVNSVTSFSSLPLIGIFYIGAIISIASGVYTGYLIINRIFIGTPLSGWTSVMASIWLLGGMIISFIGVIGIYLSKIFSETKRRPYSIIKQIYDHKDAS